MKHYACSLVEGRVCDNQTGYMCFVAPDLECPNLFMERYCSRFGLYYTPQKLALVLLSNRVAPCCYYCESLWNITSLAVASHCILCVFIYKMQWNEPC